MFSWSIVITAPPPLRLYTAESCNVSAPNTLTVGTAELASWLTLFTNTLVKLNIGVTGPVMFDVLSTITAPVSTTTPGQPESGPYCTCAPPENVAFVNPFT